MPASTHDDRFASIGRVLLPVRWRPGLAGAALELRSTILQRLAASHPLAVTLLSVLEESDHDTTLADMRALRARLPIDEVNINILNRQDPAPAIVDEAANGYDLVILGSTQAEGPHLFDSVIDAVVRDAPCPTLVVRGGQLEETWSPHRILIPYNGARASRWAAELAFALAGSQSERVVLLNVVDQATAVDAARAGNEDINPVLESRGEIVGEIRDKGAERGIRTEAEVRVGSEPDTVVIRLVKEKRFDLVVLGAELRPASRRLFLGARVERILQRADCPVIVLNVA